MTATNNFEYETEFRFILNVTKKNWAASKRRDNKAMLDHINKASARIIDCNHIGQSISTMLVRQLIYNKTPTKKMSYYKIEQTIIPMTIKSQI